jgi:hypothetical protein
MALHLNGALDSVCHGSKSAEDPDERIHQQPN